MKKKVIAAVSLLLLLAISFLFQNYFLYGFYESTLDVSYPSTISMTQNSDALIVDSGAKRIVKLSPDGTYSLKMEASALTFHNARGVCEDASGEKIYISDVVWAGNGMDVVQESIRVFDQHGKYENELLLRKHKERTPRPTLIGPFLSEETLYVAELSKDHIAIIDLMADQVCQTIYYPDANLRISSVAMQKERVLFVDKSGVIFESDGGSYRAYDCGNDDRISVPWQITTSSAGRVFFTDIAKREVVERKDDGTLQTIFAVGEGENTPPFAEQPIYYPVSVGASGTIGTVYRNQVFLKNADGTVLQNASEFKRSPAATIQKIIWLAVLLVMCALAVYLVISAIIALSHLAVWKLSTKLSLLIVFVIVTMMLIVLPITYSQGKSMYINSTMDHLSAVVDMGGKFIDTDALKKLKSPSDYMGESYLKLSQSLRKIVNKDAKYGERLYCLLYQEKDGVLYTPIFLDGTGGAYYPYDYTSKESTLNEVFRQGKLVETGLMKGSSGTWMFVQGPIYDDNHALIGAIEVGIDMNSYQQAYNTMYMKIIFSVIAAAIILQMVLMQLLDMGDFIKKRKEKRVDLREPIEFVGPLTFLMFFAFNLITAFIPLYAMRLYEPVMGLPKEFMGALPISLNLLALVGGCAVSGVLIGKYGIHKIGTIGSLLTVVSYTALAFFQNYYLFTLLFVFAGFGSGIMQNTVYAYIATTKDKEEESRGFTSYNSALFIGFNCGTVIGAQVADRFGYAAVFLATAAVFALTGLCIWNFMKSDEKPEKKEKTQYNILKFLSAPKIFLFFLCALIPFTVSNHFLFYFMPVYGETLGLSETLIGQLFLINGVCILLFSDLLTSVSQKYFKNSTTIFISMSMIIFAFALFALHPSLTMMIVVLILLGIASGFGAAAVRTYYTNQAHTTRYGKEKAMSVFATMENAGDTVGPMVFSFILAGVLRTQFFLFIGIMIACTMIFMVSSKIKDK